ncbi:MAG TPA: aminotransferase class V-fold PLP-dependent enzyme [Nevskiaceae bacterium]
MAGQELLERATAAAQGYLHAVGERTVRAELGSDELRCRLGGQLSESGEPPLQVLETLIASGGRGTSASRGGRYFGFVTGSSLPVATAADWMVSAWDQNCALQVMSPFVAAVEEVTGGWLKQLLGLPSAWSYGFVTGGTMANFTGLAAARHHVLERAGWDVEVDGLSGAPPIEVVVSDEIHYSIAVALRLLGLGAARVRKVPTDGQGRMRVVELANTLAGIDGPCIACAQAGNVNTGALDPITEIAAVTKPRGVWLHVDGAVGLWAAASDAHRTALAGVASADSVTTDAHKWLNVPYDCGLVFCAHPDAHRHAMSLASAYVQATAGERDPREYAPEESRRGRAVPVYAALRTLGRRGVADLVERCCRHARRFAEGLSAAGYEVLNEVSLNQVLVSFGDPEATGRVIAAIQRDGTCWCGGTRWHGRTAMRISVCSRATTEDDVERSLAAMLRCAAAVDARGD